MEDLEDVQRHVQDVRRVCILVCFAAKTGLFALGAMEDLNFFLKKLAARWKTLTMCNALAGCTNCVQL